MLGVELHRESLTVRHVEFGPPDENGVPSRTVTETVVPGWNVQPVGTTESIGAAELVTGRWRASGPLTQTIQPGDQILWGGTTYDVDGEPQHFTSGTLDHTELVFKRAR